METLGAPRHIGKYEVIKPLGRGATAAVYLATDGFDRRQYAIKLAHPDTLRDPEHGARFKKQFFNEAFLAGTLRHPHIVALHDAVVDEQMSYLVMEYVGGGTLKNFCTPERLLPIDYVLDIAFKCCGALDYAQTQGVIHRDIKPANILLTSDSYTDIKLSDFGAALLAHSDATQVAGLVGSPSYMSPEQVKEQPLDFRSDMFSLGAVLYELLTGHQAFAGENHFSIAYKIANEPPPPLAQYRADIPPAVADVVARALQKDPARRFPSWQAFSQAIRDAAAPTQAAAQQTIRDMEKFDLLRRLPFFQSFNDAELWETLAIAQWGRFERNTLLLREGDYGQSFFILAKGEVRVLKGDKLIDIIKPGACFGEMAYLDQAARPARSASVISETDVVLVKIRAGRLNEASRDLQLRFNQVFIQTLLSRLNATNRRWSLLSR